ncbi:PASTA domain-containing protein, partial [Ruminococcaceae bacterium OttesenSCG-928-O06]|nr:PASTA domain-containing protein [Ruminococcaceae bacterium OttesenSCG-928-O06]
GKKGSENKPMRFRVVSLFCVFVLAVGLLGWRLGVLQIDQAAEWEARASRQQLSSVTIVPQRGNIYDANLKLLAQSATVWTVVSSPDVLVQSRLKNSGTETDAARVASQKLAEILDLDEGVLYENLADSTKMYYRVKAKIEKPVADEIRAMCTEYNIGGIYLQEDTKRYYPYEEMASTVLGFVGADNDGLEGIERWYDEVLAGTPGRSMTLIDALGREIPTAGEGTTYAADDGHSIVTTIVTEIQRSLDTYLAAAVEKYNARERGFAIAMDANTGAILGISVYPSYNPNTPYEIQDADALALLELMIPGSEERSRAQGEARTLQWRNKALADTYEPGSVMKIITAAAALDSGIYTQESGFTCSGSLQVADHIMSCAGDPPARHGTISLREALIESCNISFIQMSAGMGTSTWYDYLRAFGLTEPTGVDMPGEPSQNAINNLIYSENRMGPTELASCSFGQSNKYTAVQMITAICAAVNGGNLMQPYIVAQELDADGNVVKNYEPVIKRQVVSPDTSAQIRDILEDLVTNTTNGQNAYAAGYRVGGKSGTSQKLDVMLQEDREDAFISSFVGFAPADNPQVVVLLALDEPEDTQMGNYFGGRLAGPYVREILKDCMQVYGVDPIYETDEELARSTVSTPKCTDNDVMRAQTILNSAGLFSHVVGGGDTVIGQCPAAYSQMPYGGEVVLYTDASIPQEQVTMPDLMGRTAKSATDLLRSMGLNVLTDGAPDAGSGVVVIEQSIAPETQVPRGTMVTLIMEDNTRVVDH